MLWAHFEILMIAAYISGENKGKRQRSAVKIHNSRTAKISKDNAHNNICYIEFITTTRSPMHTFTMSLL